MALHFGHNPDSSICQKNNHRRWDRSFSLWMLTLEELQNLRVLEAYFLGIIERQEGHLLSLLHVLTDCSLCCTHSVVPVSGQLHRCFRLHVESLKKLGKQAQGCKMVTLWLAALKPYSLEHMVEPVTSWVRVKMDAARAGDKKLQLQ